MLGWILLGALLGTVATIIITVLFLNKDILIEKLREKNIKKAVIKKIEIIPEKSTDTNSKKKSTGKIDPETWGNICKNHARVSLDAVDENGVDQSVEIEADDIDLSEIKEGMVIDTGLLSKEERDMSDLIGKYVKQRSSVVSLDEMSSWDEVNRELDVIFNEYFD